MSARGTANIGTGALALFLRSPSAVLAVVSAGRPRNTIKESRQLHEVVQIAHGLVVTRGGQPRPVDQASEWRLPTRLTALTSARGLLPEFFPLFFIRLHRQSVGPFHSFNFRRERWYVRWELSGAREGR